MGSGGVCFAPSGLVGFFRGGLPGPALADSLQPRLSYFALAGLEEGGLIPELVFRKGKSRNWESRKLKLKAGDAVRSRRFAGWRGEFRAARQRPPYRGGGAKADRPSRKVKAEIGKAESRNPNQKSEMGSGGVVSPLQGSLGFLGAVYLGLRSPTRSNPGYPISPLQGWRRVA